jgi:hypothetical protein
MRLFIVSWALVKPLSENSNTADLPPPMPTAT